MDFYDIVSATCTFDDAFAKRLGFKKVFIINKDIPAAGHGGENKKGLHGSIAFGKEASQLMSLVKNGASAVAITDSYIDKKLLETMADNKCVLCMPMSIITSSYGIERSRNVYRMSKLFAYARKKGIEVCFVSMAKTPEHMNSYMQLMELAKLVGADEKYAKQEMGRIEKWL